jgi:ABC-2 type transport system ATP-binding protein
VSGLGWPRDPRQSRARREATQAIEARGLTKISGGRKVVDGIDLAVAPGEVFGLLGPDGAGKTTVIRMLLGLSRPNEGEAYLLGQKVMPGTWTVRQVGAVVEQPRFYPWMSGRRNLHVLLQKRMGRSEVDAALDAVGLLDVAGAKMKTYTPGMCRRWGLALAVCSRPKVVVLDEPASGLGPGDVGTVRETIGRAASSGSAVLLSSQALDELERACDRVAVLSKGRIVASGTIRELGGDELWLSVVVSKDQHRRALDVLSPLSARADGPDRILVRARSGQEVSRRLAQAGVFPEALTKRSSTLEERFL